jgi:hypothetical protein
MLLNALFQAGICFLIPLYSLSFVQNMYGIDIDKESCGITIYSVVIMTVSLKIILVFGYKNIFNYLSILAGIVIYIIFFVGYTNGFYLTRAHFFYNSDSTYNIILHVQYWMILIFTPVLCNFRDIIFKSFQMFMKK